MRLPISIERTELRVWNIDLADSYLELGKEAERLSINQIPAKIEISECKTRKMILVLEEKNIIHKMGNGFSTKYEIVKESREFLT